MKETRGGAIRVSAGGSEGWSFVYTADDERLWAIMDVALATTANWTFRGLGNQVLTRDERRPAVPFAGGGELVLATCPSNPPFVGVFCDGFEAGNMGAWSSAPPAPTRSTTDYVYRDGKLLVSHNQQQFDQFQDFGLDHLGTIRVAANITGFLAQHTYFPFGREATSTSQDAEVMKFTGHERDLQSTPSATADDLDYMHARSHSPVTGRFLSVDPVCGNQKTPQSWNRYLYVQGNPLRYTDPDGMLLEELFNSIKNWISKKWDAAFPQQAPQPMQGIEVLEGEIGSTGNQFDNTGVESKAQGALNDIATTGLAAVATGAVVVGSDLAARGVGEKAFEAVSNGPLARALGQLFRSSDKLPGGTAGAIRFELRSGELVGGRSHLIKGAERARQLERILKNEPLSPLDSRVAQAVLDDLRGALRGE